MLRLLALTFATVLAGQAHAHGFHLQVKGPLTVRNSFDGAGCHGDNQRPAMRWTGAPAATRSFAITVHDPDAGGAGWWHWVVFDLPRSLHGLSSGAPVPAASRSSHNDFGPVGWGGPCPPTGDAPHHYVFTVYALDVDVLPLPSGASATTADAAIRRHALGQARATLTYGR
ncbi:YbhB/YbcL family Raf kinase inhibitor-like protein [Dyella sp. A6]|uniref:YbhB/YbcL family Raf kinase inhibitor-like protein n=1 Tax=Dyella aluminiiresistens TaxID=3069105 RepID=UPI002E7A0F25|nr:YbhB/YbcL family Raf kinase inhibitor-like protein [Dyella sp. A6]